MSTTHVHQPIRETGIVLLLGVLMAAAIWLLAAPELAFLGFVLAAVAGHADCVARPRHLGEAEGRAAG
jgi:hypothetical protein